jgi:acyl-coenzyme A synthetase/AMP-(fatty) acid ligase/flavin-dependent dehydrogenase
LNGDSPTGAPSYNATVDLLERNLAPDRRDLPYLIAGQRTWSYAEVAASADGAGAGLLGLGLAPGDRVVIAMADRPEFVCTFWGALKAGLVPVPASQMLSPADLLSILHDSGARAIVCDPVTGPAATEAATGAGVTAVVTEGLPLRDALRWDDVCRPDAALPPAGTTEDDIALWLYTSGTTGMPKGVMHRHRNLMAAPTPLAGNVIGLEPGDVLLSVPRMSAAYGLGGVYLTAATGAALLLTRGPVVPGFVHNLMQTTPPTVLFAVPAFARGFAALAEAEMPGSVRMALSAGEALSPQLFQAFRDRFGIELLDGLGSSEALHHVTSNLPGDVVPGSAGRALDGYEVTAVDGHDKPVADGEAGELWIRGPTTFAGYWRRPDLSAAALRPGGWMRTPDLVRIVDGRVFHEGRVDDMLRVAGMWVAPSEIEEVLRRHADVEEAAVVTMDEGRGAREVRAYVVSPRGDSGLVRELGSLCRRELAAFKVPVAIEVVDDLPRTATGKVRRFVLRDPALAPVDVLGGDAMTGHDHDVIVIGGGPAGATLGAFLGMNGYDAVILERDIHPRVHVGESLVPSVNPILEAIGFFPQMDRHGFVRKPGGSWTGPSGALGQVMSITFADAPQPGINQDYTYHVDRSRFDALLLRHASEQGARVVQGANVVAVLFDRAGRACGVRVRILDREFDMTARYVVDASGRRCLLGKQLGLMERDPVFNQYAVYSWFKGVAPARDDQWDYIFIHFLPVERGWVWQIPLSEAVTSVGVVVDKPEFQRRRRDHGDFFHDLTALSTHTRHILAGAERVMPFLVEGDFSYRMRKIAGPGWMLTGDAARFVDPIFSSGVSVAMASAQFAFQTIQRSDGGADEENAFQAYEERVQAGIQIWYEWIKIYYKLQVLFTLFSRNRQDLLQMQKLLQGQVFDRDAVDVLDRMKTAVREIEATEGHLWRKAIASSIPLD